MNTQLIIKSLCCYRKSKNDSLKSNILHGRNQIVIKRVREIQEIEIEIDQLEDQLINERLN